MAIVSFPIGRRRFAPSWAMTLLTIALCVVFVRLGEWQWQRGVHRQAEWDAFARGADAPVPLAAQSLGSLPRFKRIAVTGRWDGAHQFLIDNQSHGGLPGYAVLTPLRLADGRVLVVNRGWVPFTGSRARLPQIALLAGAPVTLTGRLDNLPVAGLALGHAAPMVGGSWPKLTGFPTLADLATALHERLEPWTLLLDPRSGDGYVRDWQPPGLSPLRHWSYAIQWWGFAVTLTIIWGIMSARRQEPRNS
jgi:surfeit locus 1 family protein